MCNGAHRSRVRASWSFSGAATGILAQVREHDSNLIVMAGYGHRCIREILFGGATRGALEQTAMPVFMSYYLRD